MFEPPKGSWEIVPFASSSATDEPVDELDRAVFEGFLRQFKSDLGIMAHLREVLAETDPVSRFTDDQVIKTIVSRVTKRDLLFRRSPWRRRPALPAPAASSQPSPDSSGTAAPAPRAAPSEEPDPDTFDQDNDVNGPASCAVAYAGAWWYSNCHSSNLNGKYLSGTHSSDADGVEWLHWTGHYYSLRFTEMKIRPN